MWQARRKWEKEGIALLAAGWLISCVPTDAAIAQIEWRAPPCLYSATTGTGTLCVRSASFNRDICRALALFADENNQPPDFFARLIWRKAGSAPMSLA